MNEATRGEGSAGGSAGQPWVAAVLRGVLRLTVRRTFRPDLPWERQRSRMRRVTRLTLPPRGTRFRSAHCRAVPGEWVEARGAARPALTFLYLHGGGYCVGSPVTHRALTGHLAARCNARVFAADYRLAPEHPFPAAVDDAVAAYRGLLAEGIQARDIVIAGDSAGGGLSVAAAVRLRERGEPMPRALVLFSPWTDLSLEQAPPPPPGEIMLTLPWIAACARAYVAAGDAHHPLASPVNADLHGLPPTLVQVGTDEILLGDAQRLHERLQAAGVAARLEAYPGRWHVFQINAGLLADADRALDSVAAFTRRA
jgi:acetyl esterase/lipase